MTEEWKVWQEAMQTLPPVVKMNARRIASKYLVDQLGTFNGQGISSSDENHAMFSIWKRNGSTIDGFLRGLIEVSQ